MFFKNLNHKQKTPFSRMLAMAGLSLCMSGCYLQNCCSGYMPEFVEDHYEAEPYEQMCYNTMNYDSKYNSNDGCYLKEVDKFIEKALECCAPLKSDMHYISFSRSELESSNALDALLIEIALATIPRCDDLGCYESLLPTNAYTYCLFNTHPRTYQCDIEASLQYENALEQCCANSDDAYSCTRDFIKNGAVCDTPCCDGLPDQDNDQYISKENCLKVLKDSKECVETPIDACCRIAPKSSSRGHIDRDICKQIYTESNGQCINTDENTTCDSFP